MRPDISGVPPLKRESRPARGGDLKTGNPGYTVGTAGREDSTKSANIEPISVRKNAREALRLAVDEWHGRTLLSARLWFEPPEGGDLRPGREGWAIAIERLPEIIAGLQQLEAAARRAGLLR